MGVGEGYSNQRRSAAPPPHFGRSTAVGAVGVDRTVVVLARNLDTRAVVPIVARSYHLEVAPRTVVVHRVPVAVSRGKDRLARLVGLNTGGKEGQRRVGPVVVLDRSGAVVGLAEVVVPLVGAVVVLAEVVVPLVGAVVVLAEVVVPLVGAVGRLAEAVGPLAVGCMSVPGNVPRKVDRRMVGCGCKHSEGPVGLGRTAVHSRDTLVP